MNNSFKPLEFIVLIVCVFAYSNSFSQKVYYINNLSEYQQLPKTCVFLKFNQYCKLSSFVFMDTSKASINNPFVKSVTPKLIKISGVKDHSQFLTVHGNITYDFYHQSHLDTPYIVNSLSQHTLSTYLDIRVKNDYPLRLYFTTRFGNSSYLRNITSLNLQYSPQTFQTIIKERIKSIIQKRLDTLILRNLRRQLSDKATEITRLQEWFESPSVTQRLVEAKEAEYARQHLNAEVKQPNVTFEGNQISSNSSNRWGWLQSQVCNQARHAEDSLQKKDSAEQSISNQYAENKKKLDSLKIQFHEIQKQYLLKKDSIAELKNLLSTRINSLRDPQQLTEFLKASKIKDSSLPKGYENLLALKKVGIGTSTLNYSELSAKDITITGLQVEYSPRYYYAVAGGVINYRFRDYLLPESKGPKQYLGLVRFGKETSNGSSLIFTYYCGRKVLYNYYTTDSIQQISLPAPNYNLMGVTLENKIKLDRNNLLTMEAAKSSLPFYHNPSFQKGVTGTFDIHERSNEAYSVKLNSNIPATQTKFEGYYKHYGANFQSFTLISTGSEQTAWLLKADQQLFRDRVSVTGSIRKNDFINSFINQQYINNTVFKSIQVTLHMKNFPVISAGFYPISQLTKLNDETFTENLFYTLTANASYFYNKKHTGMNTTVAFMQFYNRPSDNGFVYYNTKNFIVNHTVFFRKASLQSGYSNALNSNYSLQTWSENVQLKFSRWLDIGGGFKFNRQNLVSGFLLGYAFNGTIKIRDIGSLQFRGEKMYIPGINRQLVSNNMGRLTFIRSF